MHPSEIGRLAPPRASVRGRSLTDAFLDWRPRHVGSDRRDGIVIATRYRLGLWPSGTARLVADSGRTAVNEHPWRSKRPMGPSSAQADSTSSHPSGIAGPCGERDPVGLVYERSRRRVDARYRTRKNRSRRRPRRGKARCIHTVLIEGVTDHAPSVRVSGVGPGLPSEAAAQEPVVESSTAVGASVLNPERRREPVAAAQAGRGG